MEQWSSFFVSIDLNIINTLLIRLWLWVRKYPRVIVMKIWGVYSVWVHTEASFIPYHRFPPNPFFDCLCISSSLSFFPSGKPLNKTFPRLSFASRVCCWRPTVIFFKQQQGHPIPFIITLGLSLLILVHGERKQTKKKPRREAWLEIHRIRSVSSAVYNPDMQSAK